MNKTYRSIWNASLGCYVAAPESATSHTAGSSRSRTARAHPMMRSKSVLVMEPRLLFDGAMVATAIELDSGPDDAPVLEEAAETEPAEAPEATVEPEAQATAAEVPADAETAADSDPAAQDTAAATDTDTDDSELATAPEAPARTEVVFVDSRVTDPAAFGGEGREVVVIAADQDGIAQIASALAGRTGIDAIHIVSHGSDGQLSLGSGSVTAETLQSTQQAALQQIGQALTAEGDILIYACDYAAGSAGLEAIDLIADLTGADVAASSDATGHESLGGDWTLEQSTGAIETAELAPLAWMNALDFSFTGAGTVGALGMANNIMGAGVTVVSATYQGGATQSGTFTAGSGVTFGSDVLGFTSGTLLSTGENAAGVAGPNSDGGFGSDALSGVDGDPTLDAMAGYPTFDAAILNIDFIPDVPPGGSVGDVGRMTLEIVFGSDEYLEYIGSINDVMEVTVNGQVVSLVPNASGGESTIGINSVNNTANPALFIDNTAGTYNTQMDAFTITIPMVFDVIVGQTNSIRLAVADAVDNAYDSWLFVRADSGQTVVVAENDQVSTAANLPITVDLTANDYSLAGGNLTLTHIQGDPVTQGQVITLGSGIQLTVGAGGQVTVTGNGSSAANDTFTYQVSNGMGGVASATVNVDVTAPNLNPPVAQDDLEAVTADATLSDSVLANNGNGADTDPNGDPLSVVQVNLTSFTPGDPITLPSGALLTMNANGSYVYDPNGAFDGLADGATTTDSFSYTVTDGQGGNDTATVTITVTGVASNHAPVAVDDSFTAGEEGAAALGNPLDNDSDADGDPLSLSVDDVNGSQGGIVTTDDSGNLVFIAGDDFDDLAVGETRNTQFTYTLSDGQGATASATITVTVEGANDAPVTAADAFDVDEDGAWVLAGVLDNDSDPEGDGMFISFSGMAGSNGGVFTMDDGGNLIFIPGTDFDDLNDGQSRQTSFTYDVNDDHGAQTASTVTVTVHGVNDAPVATGDSFSVYEDDALILGNLTVNDSDIDGGTLQVDSSAVVAGDNGGLFSFDDGGSLVFHPNGDFNDLAEGESRSTRFDYTLYDSQGGSSLATVVVEVMGLNDAPVAADDTLAAYADHAMALGSALANDTDPEGNALQLEQVQAAGSNGGLLALDDSHNLIFNPDGAFDDLAAGETRDTSFSYTVADSLGGLSQALLTVTVTGVNDNPVAEDDAYDTGNRSAVMLGNPMVNDSDADGDTLDLGQTSTGEGSHGGLFSVDDGGGLVFDPDGAFDDLAEGDTRETSFTYTVTDGQGGSATATVTVTVRSEVDGGDDEVVAMSSPSYPNEVVFVDARIPDPQAFAVDGRELVVLNLDDDGLLQIAAALNGRSGVEAVHIVSHGGDGYLTLGSGDIDAASIQSVHLPALQTMASALTEGGDILIYACDFAASEVGQNTMQLLAQYTVADVSASLGTTGHPTLNGNWVLEVAVGSVEAQTITPENWVYALNQPVAGEPAAPAPATYALSTESAPGPVTVSAEPVTPVATVLALHTPTDTRSLPAVGGAPAQAALEAVRMVTLEEVFRQTLSPYLPAATDAVTDTATSADPLWAAPAITVDTDLGRPEGWQPTAEFLDDALVHEALVNEELPEAREVDALELPRQHAAPGFAAQLARWSQWGNQRPLTRAAARA